MDIKSFDHIYECYPPVFGNEGKTVKVKLKCVPKPDFDTQAILESTVGMEARRKSGFDFICAAIASLLSLPFSLKGNFALDQSLVISS